MSIPSGLDPQDYPEPWPICLECGRVCEEIHRAGVCFDCLGDIEKEEAREREDDHRRES